MIDWIKITLPNFSGNFDYCRKDKTQIDPETGIVYDNYHIPNQRKWPKTHLMSVSQQVNSKTVRIEGSIRKWGDHRDTLTDLTATNFESTLKKLAEQLGIPFEEICRARFTQCEIGLNIETRIPCSEIIPMVVRYGALKKNSKKSHYGESIYFIGKAKSLKIYDKGKEIADKAKGRSSHHVNERRTNVLRIEYTLPHRKGFTQNRLGHIKTIGDLIVHYKDLYTFWCRETGRIVLFNNSIMPVKRGMTLSEFTIALDLKREGFERAVDMNEIGINPYAKTAPQMQSRALRKLLAVIDKYYSHGGYNKHTLRADAVRQLFYKYRNEGVDIPMNECIRALWAKVFNNNNK